MQIAEHIKSLLYRYQYVVIPGFGAFLAQRKSAQIHESTHAFYPPKATISFNRQLHENDGVLANYIAKSEEISYQQSLDEIYAFVENIHESLEAHSQIRFNEIGSFYTKDDKILFQPFLHTNYLLEAFGTDSFTSAQIVREKPQLETEEKGIKTIPLVAENQTASTKSDKNLSQEKEKNGGHSIYWKYAAVGVIAIGIGGFFTANWYSSQIELHNIAAQQEAKHQIENKIQQANFVMESPLPEVTFKIKAKRGKYHIVAGAFRQKENAEKKLKELKKQGFHAKYIGANKYGLHQVIYDSYEKRRKALNELYQIQRENNSEAWLLVKEL